MQETVNRRILITGGAGFVGYHLASKLSEDAGNSITLVDNFVRGERERDLEVLLGKENVTMKSLDLTDTTAYAELGSRYDAVYHLAAIIGVKNVLKRPHDVVRVNAVSTLLLLDWFVKGGGKKILFSSTSEAYAWTKQFHQLPIPTPEDVPLALTDLQNPRSSYAGSKIFGELAMRQYCTKHGKPFTIVRYHNVYGPRMGNEHVIPEVYYRALRGQNPLVIYSASFKRAFCYVNDAVQATRVAMDNDAANGQTINIGNDKEEIRMGNLAKKLLAVAGIEASIEPKEAENDPIARRCPDITRARELLGYEPQVDLDTGLSKTLVWYKERFNG